MSLLRRDRLAGVHDDLVRMVERAAEMCPQDIVVLEGVRSYERQQELYAKGASRTLNSKHLTGRAIDLAPMLDEDGDGKREVSWHWPHYRELAKYVKRAAVELDIDVEWGGDWKSFPDGPHWQLQGGKS